MKNLIDVITECQKRNFFGKITITFRKGIPTYVNKEETLALDSSPSTQEEKTKDLEDLKSKINNRSIKEEPK